RGAGGVPAPGQPGLAGPGQQPGGRPRRPGAGALAAPGATRATRPAREPAWPAHSGCTARAVRRAPAGVSNPGPGWRPGFAAPTRKAVPMYADFTIQNFRGVRSLTIEGLRRINLIVGRNNTGKTTVLEALFLLGGATNSAFPTTVGELRGHHLGRSHP